MEDFLETDFENLIFEEVVEQEPTNQENQNDEQQQPASDYITRILQDRGVDRLKIKVRNDVGEIEEVLFDDLDDNDKYELLKDVPTPITDDELNTLNYLRRNNMSILDFANWQRDEAIREYLQQNQSYTTDIDTLSDEDVFVYDLVFRFGDSLTDDEISQELERAKQNEEGFQKTVGLLRDQYRKQDLEQIQAQEAAMQELRKADFNNFVDSMVNAARDINEIQGVELDDNDKNAILDFLLEDNPLGQTGFSKLLNDPEALFRMAWFALYGEETFNTTVDYFKNEIAKARRGTPAKTKVVQKLNPPKGNEDPFNLDDIFN